MNGWFIINQYVINNIIFKYYYILLQVSPVTNVLNVFAAYLQIVLENSAGAMKLKIIEYGADKPFEGIFIPNVVNILESEPLISVIIKYHLKYNCNTFHLTIINFFSWMRL